MGALDVAGNVEFVRIDDGGTLHANVEAADARDDDLVAIEQVLPHDSGEFSEHEDDIRLTGGAVMRDFASELVEAYAV